MLKFTKESFENVAKAHELRRVNISKYLALDCNIMFEYDEEQNCVCACGVIPIELATKMYDIFKDKDVKPFSNSRDHSLKNPVEIVQHQNIDLEKIMFLSTRTGKTFSEVYTNIREEALKEDYDNCYIDCSYIYSPECFDWFVGFVQNYYSIKYNKIKKMSL